VTGRKVQACHGILAAMRLVVAFAALVVAAGCMDTHRPPADTSSSAAPVPEPDSAVFEVDVDAQGATTLQVPLPHLDMCLQPAEWMAGRVSARNATAALQHVDRGQVVAVTGAGTASWSVQLNTTGRPTCQTFRYDPWSTDPDPNGTAVDVRGQGAIAHASVLVRWVRSGCGQATLYDGTPAAGNWTALDGRTIPVGC
jgi:hypothetical protein